MNEAYKQNETLNLIAKVLIWSAIMGFVSIFLWFGIIAWGNDFCYTLHSRWFPISKEQFYAIHYAGILFTKLIVVTFFLIPYLAIRVVQYK